LGRHRRNRDRSARGCVFNGVIDEIHKYLLETVVIPDQWRQFRRTGVNQSHSGPFGFFFHYLKNFTGLIP
jgi:hypothetical protein